MSDVHVRPEAHQKIRCTRCGKEIPRISSFFTDEDPGLKCGKCMVKCLGPSQAKRKRDGGDK